ncbi:MAG: hypothetical protein LKJ76_03805 [Lachnospiraceae bacterium]|jgi:hypothetical protein|nr:hypothetical protein [Lachnospiraceae bacterium]
MNQAVENYTLCYRPSDGKLIVGFECTEQKEKFTGLFTDRIADIRGYSGQGSNLTLTDFTFTTTADIALYVPGGTTIRFAGNNKLTVEGGRPDANIAVLYADGDLTIKGGETDHLRINATAMTGLWSRAVCARAGDLAIHGGCISASGGCAKKNCGLYAGGHLFIDSRDKGKISITDGFIRAAAIPNAIRATEGGLSISAGAQIENAKEFPENDSHSNNLITTSDWTGDCLTQADDHQDLVICFPSYTKSR